MYVTEESGSGGRRVVVSGSSRSLVEVLISSITSLAARSKKMTSVKRHLN